MVKMVKIVFVFYEIVLISCIQEYSQFDLNFTSGIELKKTAFNSVKGKVL